MNSNSCIFLVENVELSVREEDYLESLYRLLEEKGFLRLKELAEKEGVSPPTALEMIKKLEKKGFLKHGRHFPIKLTELGLKTGRHISSRHQVFFDFLQFLEIPKGIAEKDACKMEHHLDPATVERFSQFVDFIKKSPQKEKISDAFRGFKAVKPSA